MYQYRALLGVAFRKLDVSAVAHSDDASSGRLRLFDRHSRLHILWIYIPSASENHSTPLPEDISTSWALLPYVGVGPTIQTQGLQSNANMISCTALQALFPRGMHTQIADSLLASLSDLRHRSCRCSMRFCRDLQQRSKVCLRSMKLRLQPSDQLKLP